MNSQHFYTNSIAFVIIFCPQPLESKKLNSGVGRQDFGALWWLCEVVWGKPILKTLSEAQRTQAIESETWIISAAKTNRILVILLVPHHLPVGDENAIWNIIETHIEIGRENMEGTESHLCQPSLKILQKNASSYKWRRSGGDVFSIDHKIIIKSS